MVRDRFVGARFLAATLLALLVTCVAGTTASAAPRSPGTTERAADGGACSEATTEAACLALVACAWGVLESAPECFDTGEPASAQPGTGDPGGGGAQASGDDGAEGGDCASSGGRRSSSSSSHGSLALVALVSLVSVARRRSAPRTRS